MEMLLTPTQKTNLSLFLDNKNETKKVVTLLNKCNNLQIMTL